MLVFARIGLLCTAWDDSGGVSVEKEKREEKGEEEGGKIGDRIHRAGDSLP